MSKGKEMASFKCVCVSVCVVGGYVLKRGRVKRKDKRKGKWNIQVSFSEHVSTAN